MDDDLDIGSKDFNALPAATLDEARALAAARASACGHEVHIFEHIGGRNTFGKRVHPKGTFLVRDAIKDHEGSPVESVPRFYREVEIVKPAA